MLAFEPHDPENPMKSRQPHGLWILSALLILSAACTGSTGSSDSRQHDSPPPDPTEVDSAAAELSPAEVWWSHLSALCGKAFTGAVVSEGPSDASFAAEVLTMHVRRCEETRLEIPFHVGENRSRTWVLTHTEEGLKLQHDHRHEDGSEDTVTLYGGHTDGPGTEVAQHFPADEFSKQLFEANGLDASVANVWSMELVPGERFSYILRRPDRHFRADFSLHKGVEPPPAPWGHE